MIHVTEDGERVTCPACGACKFDDEGRCEDCGADRSQQIAEAAEQEGERS